MNRGPRRHVYSTLSKKSSASDCDNGVDQAQIRSYGSCAIIVAFLCGTKMRIAVPHLLAMTLVVSAISTSEGVAEAPVPIPAPDKQFWSFAPLKKPLPPEVENKRWARNNIDRFILAKLEEKHISPSAAVEKRKLIRRACFDLIGLPPTPEEVEAFVNDKSREAYDRLIDRLLASPHYGERWGRHWLDLARFAESHGYEQDYDRTNAYHYRDFVIEALNQDLPYDTFVKWQLAGDELAPDSLLAMKATGFLAAGTHATQITANQAEKERYDELDDLAGTIGTAMLGLTIGCARCHDHKFDPIPTHDYYRMISIFTKTVRSDYDVLVDPPRYRLEKEQFDREHHPLARALEKFEQEQLPARLTAWEQSGARPEAPVWLVLDNATAVAKGKATFTPQADGSFLVGGENTDFDVFTFTATAPVPGITAVKLEALADPSMEKNGPGRADNGNFALSDFKLAIRAAGSSNQIESRFIKATATFEQSGLPVSAAIDSDPKSGWAIDPKFGTNHAAVFELDSPLTNSGTLIITLKFDTNNKHSIGRPRLSVTTSLKAGLDDDPGPAGFAELNTILATPSAERTDKEKATLLKWYRRRDEQWLQLEGAIIAQAKKEPRPEKVKVLISSEGVPAVRLNTQGPDFYTNTYFLKRGDLNQKEGEAPPGFLQVLMSTPEKEKHWLKEPPPEAKTSFRRACLANWITDCDLGAGPLLARVVVNRLWQHHFGRGLVGTPSDFGAQGEKPTHPELLDWLANEIVRNGWHLKPMHKLMMTSATYRQGPGQNLKSPMASSEQSALDPENTLHWRRVPQRQEAEVIRDAILFVSGRLDLKMFGPGTLDEAQSRRSIYFTIKRSHLIPMMVQFDAPDSLQGMGRRPQTTVAPQALLLLNNPQIRGAALAFAGKVERTATGSPATAIQAAYLAALGRPPKEDELIETVEFVKSQTASYQTAGKKDAPELALTDLCQALFGLNEFIYVE